jgi:hypothetical protein
MRDVAFFLFVAMLLVASYPESTGKIAGRIANGFHSTSCEKPHDQP